MRTSIQCLSSFNLMLIGVLAASMAHGAGDRIAGERKAASCMACHGPLGHSVNPVWPNLAGQKDLYLIKQLKDFKEGRRQDPLMSPMAQSLSEQDMQDLAAYFSSVK